MTSRETFTQRSRVQGSKFKVPWQRDDKGDEYQKLLTEYNGRFIKKIKTIFNFIKKYLRLALRLCAFA